MKILLILTLSLTILFSNVWKAGVSAGLPVFHTFKTTNIRECQSTNELNSIYRFALSQTEENKIADQQNSRNNLIFGGSPVQLQSGFG